MKTSTLSMKVISFPARRPSSGIRHLGSFFSGLASVVRRLSSVILFLAALVLAGAGCSTPPKIVRTDPEIERNAAAARGAYTTGALEKAADYYQKALQRARVMDAPLEIARNAYNLAACLAALQDYDGALGNLAEARSEFRRAGVSCPELPLLEARIERARGRFQEAVNLARAELARPEVSSGSNGTILTKWHILLAELLCDQGKPAEAAAELALINLKQLEKSGNESQAETALVRARIQVLETNPRGAAAQYDNAAHHWQAAGRYSAMADALAEAGRAYDNAGNISMAADRYYRAARSLFAGGQLAPARDIVNRALKLTVTAQLSDLRDQLQGLAADMDEKTPAPAREAKK